MEQDPEAESPGGEAARDEGPTRSPETRSLDTGAPPPSDTRPTFAAGEWLAGRYRVGKLLGRGGMGEVFEAWDDELSIPVALKTLRLDVARYPKALWRLKQEVLLARAVAHPNVCRVYDLGKHGEGASATWFLTMEILHGQTLQDRLTRQGKLGREQALGLATGMVEGLRAAHRAGVVHRDFKSGNVMLVFGPEGERAVVTDFGQAGPASATRDEGPDMAGDPVPPQGLVGTPAFMSPEQVRGEEAGPAADIYALGVVLFQMVTGRLPFEGGRSIDVALRRLEIDAPSPRSFAPDLEDTWERAILRCLSRSPADRFERVEDVIVSLAPDRASSSREGPASSVTEAAGRARRTLPEERDAFVGREEEIADLGRRFEGGSPLVTLLGPGGMGKTRLARQYGLRSAGRWPGGVWFCDLTDARGVDGIVSGVAGALGVPLGKGDPVEQLGHAIAGRGASLLILDNFEQVVESASRTVARWLARAAEARFLVTSRVRLRVPGEDVAAIEPLPASTGVDLFVERALRQRPGLALRGAEMSSVRDVVRLVEGMPLAIELAAARMRVMTAAQIAERMHERFRLLSASVEGKHATLRATIDGSWEMLQPWEKSAWAQCSVFEGGFTLEAAEGVLDLRAWSAAPWVVDVVQSLVEKSLVRSWMVDTPSGLPEARFGLFVHLQDYARMRLAEEGSQAPGPEKETAERAAETRHGSWYARFGADEAVDALDGPGGIDRRSALGRDLENLRAACTRAVSRRDGETAVAAARAAWAVIELRGPFGAAVDLGTQVLAMGLSRPERARAVTVLAQAEWRAGRIDEARSYLQEALAVSREVGDTRGEGEALATLGFIDYEQNRLGEARALLETSLALHRQAGERSLEGAVLRHLGVVIVEQGYVEEGRARYEASLAISREVGHRRAEAMALSSLGVLHLDQGRLDRARAHYEAAITILREIGDRRGEAIVTGNLGLLHMNQGRMQEARVGYEAALAIHRDIGDRPFEGRVLGNLGLLRDALGLAEEALADYEAALAIHREVGNRRSESIVLANLGTHHLSRGRVEPTRSCYESALAIAREAGDRQSEGVFVGNLGTLYVEEGRFEEGRAALAQAEALLREVHNPGELSRVVCARAELDRLAGSLDSARAGLREAESLVAGSGIGRETPLGRTLAALRQALDGTT